MPSQTPTKHSPSVQSFSLITFHKSKAIMRCVGFRQTLLKKPHKNVYEVTSDSKQRGSLPPSLPHSTPHPTLNPTFPPIQLTHRSLIFLSKSYVLEIPILSPVYFGSLFDFPSLPHPPGFLLIPTWVSKGFPLLLLGEKKKKLKKRDEFRTYRVENKSHEKAALACKSAETGLPTHLFQKPPPWEGIPLE